MEHVMRFRHNVMNINSISAFEGIRGGVNRDCKDVYFVRLAGTNSTLVSDVVRMDADMTLRLTDGRTAYRRVLSLPQIKSREEAAEYEGFYQAWTAGGRVSAATKILQDQAEYQSLFSEGLKKVLDLYFAGKEKNPSIEKNFAVKLLFWHDVLLADIRKQWDRRQSVKLVISNVIKKQEYLFAYLLTLLGCDVLLLQSDADIAEPEEALGLSQKVVIGAFGKITLPEYKPEAARESAAAAKPADVTRRDLTGERHTGALSPVHVKKTAQAEADEERTRQTARPVNTRKAAPQGVSQEPQEKTFEQLALLASSVVLIGIHDRQGKILGTGSGIMIGRDGYILTNSHVASGGVFYSIRIEEDETVYSTDELIKYHSVLDLAVLRIDRTLAPLPIYQGNGRLVRGQKVVAIGSPLGLFNSVSDGIISGFRKIDGVDMIQFTAPTSHGSSGGALLNMYGEVIGISTAGFDNAQNINLAVGYESILPFVKGFY